MALQLPHRTLLRRAATTAALGALLAPAAGVAPAAAKSKRSKLPTVSQVRPMQLNVGDTLEIRGRNFIRGRGKNTVVFQRQGAKAIFVKAGIGTRRLIKVQLPDRMQSLLLTRDGALTPTRFRIRILAARFGKRFTRDAGSPVIGPKPAPPAAQPAAPGADPVSPGAPDAPDAPDGPLFDPLGPAGDCDEDKVLNGADADDDGDLLPDDVEARVNSKLDDAEIGGGRMNPCDADSDADRVPDGYEYKSGRDFNDDEYQDPNAYLPAPEKRGYPNPLDGTDATADYDGDGLSLEQEHRLYRFQLRKDGVDPATLTIDTPLSYSDGYQFSIHRREGRKLLPALAAEGYDRAADFLAWTATAGYQTVVLAPAGQSFHLLDFNRDGELSTEPRDGHRWSETTYYDLDSDGWLADDERDEDADGISNMDEANNRMQPGWWTARYPRERGYRIAFVGTDFVDADSDGDGVRDGADDQDADDVPNVVELSRNLVSGRPFDDPKTKVADGNPVPSHGRVQPFNPCLPDMMSRGCPRYIPFSDPWAPFDTPPWTPDGDDPDYLVLN